jgi:TldD protein
VKVRDLLAELARESDGYVELRYHNRLTQSVRVEKGKVEAGRVTRRRGVGVRVLDAGAFGFASTSRADRDSVRAAIDRARKAARGTGALRRERIPDLAPADLARGSFVDDAYGELLQAPLEQKVELALEGERRARSSAQSVQSAQCRYQEIFEEKVIATSDGADVEVRLVRPEFIVASVAERDGELMQARESVGATGNWTCLFERRTADQMADEASRKAVELLDAGHPEGGHATVILSPALVGLLAHEAIGHTVEADFVLSGSVAQGKIGQRVASDFVTLVDSGASEFAPGAGGTLPVDDEGVRAGKTTIIRDGILESYLHNRESAARFQVEPTGNARAWEFSDQPIIRMRNTHILPGQLSLEEIIASTQDGYLLEGPEGGQADATGEFMFGVQEARRIRNGQVAELVRGVTISGIAFDVLQTVDAVSSEFRWDLGAGYCGKFQPAKVDAGGPYLRCQVTLGGRQG